MKNPRTIKFTDLEIKPLSLSQNSPVIIPQSWTRVQFNMPGDWDKLEKVSQWVTENTTDEWSGYNYPSDKKHERVVVYKFRDKNDALMFKLRGGHQCWQEAN